MLGAGGMGEVGKAPDTELDRDVAVKVSKSEFTARFKQEACTLAALTRANICQIYDVGPLPPDKAAACAGQIPDALDAASQGFPVPRSEAGECGGRHMEAKQSGILGWHAPLLEICHFPPPEALILPVEQPGPRKARSRVTLVEHFVDELRRRVPVGNKPHTPVAAEVSDKNFTGKVLAGVVLYGRV